MNSDQLSLFTPKGVRHSSAASYREIRRDGTLGNQEARIFDLLNVNPPMTLREIQAATGLEINAVSGRVNGLKKKGLVMECNRRECSITGRGVIPVTVRR